MFKRVVKPITTLPKNYREVHHLSLSKRGVMIWLNLLSLIPLTISGLLVFGALLIYHEELDAPLVITSLPSELPSLVGFAVILGVLPLHEWFHGLAIRYYGHEPRYGFKWYVLFATSDGALFRRSEFIHIALMPLVGITLLGSVIMAFLPQGVAYWIGLAVTLNAAGAVGDLWMTAEALRFESSVLIRDEEDSMRFFSRLHNQPRNH